MCHWAEAQHWTEIHSVEDLPVFESENELEFMYDYTSVTLANLLAPREREPEGAEKRC